jgi:acetoin utilization deacetylase AcuC-like enzyme
MLFFTHPSMLGHQPPRGHAEHAGRLQAVLDAFETVSLDRREAPLAAAVALSRVHAGDYVELLNAAFEQTSDGLVRLDPDTFISSGSREAAYRAAGACVAAVDAVLANQGDVAFCAVRPPGHHAEPQQAMGFCLFNNVAIAAKHALDHHRMQRVAIVDFDVHHGNGSQTIAEHDDRILFVSTHQAPLYPGTGAAYERGPANNVVNAPLPAGAGGALWRQVMDDKILPAIDAWAPQLILVSAGFDAHRADPLAQMELEEADFAWAGGALLELSLRHCKGKLVSTLEGGYDLGALARSAFAYVGALQRD